MSRFSAGMTEVLAAGPTFLRSLSPAGTGQAVGRSPLCYRPVSLKSAIALRSNC